MNNLRSFKGDHIQTYDVIVVGGGGSGLAAAVSAVEHGASVLLLEKRPELGGTTGIAVGSYTANRTRWQAAAGVQDSVDAHAEDAGKFPPAAYEAVNNAELRRFFLAHANETLEWLEGMGLRFLGPNPEPPNRAPRMHNVVPGAKAYIALLQARLLRLGGEVRTNAAAVGLEREEGRVTGVTVEMDGARTTFLAGSGVVLAAGDYTNSPDLIGQYRGQEFTPIEGINPYSTGDGHVLAQQAGAQLVNMHVTYGPEIRFIAPPGKTFQQLLPVNAPFVKLMGRLLPLVPQFLMNIMVRRLLVTWQHPENSLYEDGAILVNQGGERFCDETDSPAREIAIARQPGKIAYILLDERLSERYSQWPHFISTAPKIAYAYVRDYLRLRPDVAVQGGLSEVAGRREIPAAALAETVAAINRERQAAGGSPLVGERWALLGPAKAYFTTTEGGAAINHDFQALTPADDPIPGLYAVGQNGLGGQVLWGHGLHIAWAMTSGRMVGARLGDKASS
ncbi:MAG: FAD-dependent oxidoreductase [Caldilineales bacterium]|nr:FAD-dependent oxidoreductase [Caldilineales bacterium]